MKPSPLAAKMGKWFAGILDSLRALPVDLPGTALNHGRKVHASTYSYQKLVTLSNSFFMSKQTIFYKKTTKLF
jgi:hypothetical protein